MGPAIALGAVVAPPDAVAATAVLRQLRSPHRILTILEGESLLNDATALLAMQGLTLKLSCARSICMTMIRSAANCGRPGNARCAPAWRMLRNADSPVAAAVRQEFTSHLTDERADAETGDTMRSAHAELHRDALRAARQAVLAMRANREIGDDAFHRIEEELDWLEMAGGRDGA